jgi:hypothetical protein
LLFGNIVLGALAQLGQEGKIDNWATISDKG